MKLEVFFDYACPYCETGLGYLKKHIAAHPDIELVWQPCESHPRPERYGIHSDLAIQGLFYALDQGFGAWDYHDRVFKAVFAERLNIENIDVLASCAKDIGIDPEPYKDAVLSGKYARRQQEGNRYAWGENALHAVPSYRAGGARLNSRDGRPVSEKQLADFLDLVDSR